MGRLHVSLTSKLSIKGSTRKNILKNEVAEQKCLRSPGPHDRHGPSPILYDTAPLFVYTDQLLRHCLFICSNVH